MSQDRYGSDGRVPPPKTRRERYKERYEAAKARGESFFPYTVFTDAIMSLVVFVVIVILAAFVGAETGPIADPTSSTFNPRPEWYFLFLFELLKFFPGRLEGVVVAVLPAIGVIVLLALPFLDRHSLRRYPLKRPVAVGLGIVVVLAIMSLTYAGYAAPLLNPPSNESPLVAKGQRVFRDRNCLYCHSLGGAGGAVGPDLSNIAGQLNQQQILSYLTNPDSMIPNSLHPKLQFTSDELQALVAYLLTLGAPVTYSADAPRLFAQECASCHTTDGSGGKVGPDLSKVGSFRSVDYLAAFISDPATVVAGGAMPAFKDRLSEAQIRDVAAYLSSLKGSGGSTTTTTVASDASALFEKTCGGCHSSLPGAGLTASQAADVIRTGRDGMPSFASQLAPEQIEELSEFVTSGSSSAGSTTTTTGASDASALFAQKCTGCHSSSRPGAGLTASQAADIIRNGKDGMPSFAGQLTSEQVEELGEYLTAGSSSEESTTTTTGASTASALFAQKCTSCHSSSRPGAGLTASQAAGIIRNGRGSMPSFAGQLTSEQVEELAEYLANPAASTTTTTAAASASALFAQKCTGCHSSRPGAGLTASQAAGIIRNGRGGMPSFGSQLTSAQISSLAAYVARPAASTTTTTAAASASALFAQKCTGCHSSPPGAGLTASQAADIIRNGKDGMPSFAGQLTSEQVEELGEDSTGGSSSTTGTTAGTHPAWKTLTSQQFAFELAKVGITVFGSGQSAIYLKNGVVIDFDDLLNYLPAGEFYKDSLGYHYVQEEGAINPTTGLPALVTKPPTTTTTTTTTTSTTGTSAVDGGALYTQYCRSCHSSGVGAGLTPAQIESTIAGGKGFMPSFSSSMTGAQITALAAYVAGGGH